MLEQLRGAWERLEPRQRITLGASAAITLIGLAIVGYLSTRPSYSVLYRGLAPEDAAAVVDELRAAKTPYRLAAGGANVEVPTPLLHETRLALASKGLPSPSSVGFELFDRSTLPGTDFSNSVNLQRALQGELARTISALDEVRSARVHLSMPKESLYEEPTPPTASVLVDLGPNGTLRPEQVRGVAYLVASAVPGMKQEDVTIIDTLGHVLHGKGAGGGDLSDTTLSTAKAYSEALTARLQGMLDVMFGPHMTIVRAQAELDLDQEETDEERLEPVSTTERTGSVAREHTAEETYSGSGAGRGGLSGVPSNLLGGGLAGGVEGVGQYRSTEQTREYNFSRRKTVRVRKPGRVTRLTVAAVVDESLAVQGVDRVREVLEAAAGIDPARGDSIVVRPIKLKSAELAAEEAKALEAERIAQHRQRTLELLLQRGLPMALGVILLAVFVRTAREFRRAAEPSLAEAPTPAEDLTDLEELRQQLAATRQQEEEAGEETTSESTPGQIQEEYAAIEELRRIAREQPDLLAEELRSLVSGQDNL